MKGIMFKEPIFNAVIKGMKTQTRRVVKPQPTMGDNYVWQWSYKPNKILPKVGFSTPERIPKSVIHEAARYKVGEKVYLKEPYLQRAYIDPYVYSYTYAFDMTANERKHAGFKNKMFMPESAARYFIEITGVRVERLNDISETDAINEGIMVYGEDWIHKMFPEYAKDYLLWELTNAECPLEIMPPLGTTPKQRFEKLWDSINKPPYAWDQNPFVWVYDFKLIQP